MNYMNRNLLVGLIILALVAAFGVYLFAMREPGGTASITGTVSYRERIALPPGSTIEVQILNTSKTDASDKVFAEIGFITKGENVPVPFLITYDPTKIIAGDSYALSARILVDEEVRWASGANAPFLDANGVPVASADLMLVSAPSTISADDLSGKKFRMVSYNGTAVPEDAVYTVGFSDDAVQVQVCNSMGGSANLEEGILRGTLASTLKFCTGPAGIMDIEAGMQSMLSSGASVSLSGENLTLSGAGSIAIFVQEN